MEQYKQEFIDFMIASDVLKFGDFTLKSGRKSPFFMNAGAYVTGTQLRKLGEYYAKAIHDNYGDRVVIIEDVTTSGKSIEETFPIIRAQADVEIKGLIVSLNRCERGKGEKSALEEIRELYGFPTAAIVSMEEVVEYLYNKPHEGKIIIDDAMKASLDAYYEQYGAK